MSPDPVGTVRIFRGDGVVEKVVYVGLAVPAIGLDSHMVFAFTRGDSVVPHFTLDSVQGQGSYAFHLDLIPRAELATHLAYVDWAHTPLTATYDEVEARPGLSKAAIGPRQYAMMSPWMLVHRAEEDAFAGIEDAVRAYFDHWVVAARRATSRRTSSPTWPTPTWPPATCATGPTSSTPTSTRSGRRSPGSSATRRWRTSGLQLLDNAITATGERPA